MPVLPQGRDHGALATSPRTASEATLPFPDADLMYIVDLLPGPEKERYLKIREFLQASVRQASIDYWNREEFPF